MNRNNVVLIKYNGKVDCFDQLIPDLGMAYLTTSLKMANINHIFYDLSLWKNSESELIDIINELNPTYVGMKLQNIGKGIQQDIQLAKKIKKNTNCKLIAGGPIVRLFDDICYKVKDFQVFDALVYGDGEESIVKLYNAYLKNGNLANVPNLIYLDNDRIIKTDWKLADFNNIPPVSWHAFDLKQYIPILPINMKRGCQFACSFCSHAHLWGRTKLLDNSCVSSNEEFMKFNRIRLRSWESIKEEIKRIYYDYGVRMIYIVDSTPSKSLLEKFAEYVALNNMNIKWIAFARFGLFSELNINKFQKSGLSALWYGWESGDNKILKLMYKKFNTKTIHKTYSFLKDKNIFIAGSFIVGHPGENQASLRNTFKLIEDLDLKNYSISPFRLTPGSYISYNPREYNITLYPNWEKKILDGYMKGKSELEVEYYLINGMTNIEWWSTFKDSCDYLKWYDMRVRENNEIMYLVASHLKTNYMELLEDFLKIFQNRNKDKLDNFLKVLWKRKV